MSTPQPRPRELLIVDDEAPARERLERIVAEIPGWEVIGACASGAEALDFVRAQRPDVVLLDIQMPGLSGIDVARQLAGLEPPPAVVFTTAFDEFALDAFDSRAAGYVLKPVRRERLAAALEHAGQVADGLRRARERASAPRDHLAVRVRDEIRLIPLHEIRYLQADQKYTTVVHEHGEDLIDDSLVQLEQEFGRQFVRIHRSLLVAVAHVAALERAGDGSYRVRVRDTGERLPVSRRQVSELKARLAAGR